MAVTLDPHLRSIAIAFNDRIGKIPTRGGTGDQTSHRHAVAAHIHDAASCGCILLADILTGSPHVVAKMGLNHTYVANFSGTDQLRQHCRLRMATVHEGFHEKDAVASSRLNRGHGLGMINGKWFLAEDVLAGFGATHGPSGVQVVGQGDVNGVDIRISKQGIVSLVNPGNFKFASEPIGQLPGATCHRHQLTAGRLPDGSGKGVGYATRSQNAPPNHYSGTKSRSPQE